ncbi:MAG: hypothetical protein IPJ62_00275 [Betaproteobacteria bacterium]|nr:hypothetical protein [Betaproteobacteria bacterium]
MRLDDAIRRRGFRRWYEQQLIDGHLWLVTGFLALIMMLIALEVIPFRDSVAGLFLLTLIAIVGGGLCVVAWRRFTLLLFRAEHLAERAVCPECGTYARFTIEQATEVADAVGGWRLVLRCRECACRWTME